MGTNTHNQQAAIQWPSTVPLPPGSGMAVRTSAEGGLRTLHVLDWQNLSRGQCPHGPESVIRLWDSYVAASGYQVGDHGVVSAGRGALAALMGSVASPFWHLNAPPGPDGADAVLLSVAFDKVASGRYERLVIGSGDWSFTFLARIATRRGLVVDVVCRNESCSRMLRLEARLVRRIDEPSRGS